MSIITLIIGLAVEIKFLQYLNTNFHVLVAIYCVYSQLKGLFELMISEAMNTYANIEIKSQIHFPRLL